MSKLHQITEEDLQTLERSLPELQAALIDVLAGPDAPRLRTHLRSVKTILSNVRWDYGPPEQVERVEGEPTT